MPPAQCKVAKMNEQAAVDLGADILGEGVIISVAIAGLYLEYWRRSKNDTDKETRALDRLARIEQQLSEVGINLTNQSAKLTELERLIHHSPPAKQNSPAPSAVSNLKGIIKNAVQLSSVIEKVQPTASAPILQIDTNQLLVMILFLSYTIRDQIDKGKEFVYRLKRSR
ncbi:unnamed protein product [Didymodactylos carnosus]|uniref:OPA3-like protein n=1 Tax=Didymodactylos carnosus TaxID=1234261 RepID=A0A813U7T7_9BILA|nr:unnamed protein product [Didymodactylos carnosus]CAF1495610.1 unnamed protein product [Didymodactylos carnosus]CAF3611615.1 unnamed protein product [Didymodactylos carnosus]CAF4284665.1 unnamed protein product [Didymodactylos carnosus]